MHTEAVQSHLRLMLGFKNETRAPNLYPTKRVTTNQHWLVPFGGNGKMTVRVSGATLHNFLIMVFNVFHHIQISRIKLKTTTTPDLKLSIIGY